MTINVAIDIIEYKIYRFESIVIECPRQSNFMGLLKNHPAVSGMMFAFV